LLLANLIKINAVILYFSPTFASADYNLKWSCVSLAINAINMIKKHKLWKRLNAIILLSAFAMPFMLNSFHYIIFEHDHNCEHHHELSITNNTQTHSNCQWDFSLGDFNDNNIDLINQSFTFLGFVENNNQSYTLALLRLFALRAPPSVL